MRKPLFRADAAKRTVSVTLNSDLHDKARAAGLNVSRIADEALAEALRRHVAERIRKEIEQDLAVCNAFVEEHGSFAEMAREHYAAKDADASV
jgi:antitoxin CcdA